MSLLMFDPEDAWKYISEEYNLSKNQFGRKISFVKDPFKRKVLFRDIGQAYILSSTGFNKSAVILSGSIIEELLRLYIISKNIVIKKHTFDSYVKICEENGLLKKSVYQLTDSVRYFRNLVHMEKEDSPRMTISAATAKTSVASIFTMVNDFQN